MIFAAIIILLSLETNHSVGDFGLFYFQASVVSCSSVNNCDNSSVNSSVNNCVNNCDNSSVNNCVIIVVVHQEAAAAEDP